eukprot:7268826-Pyramimonas_sp.AAC.1
MKSLGTPRTSTPEEGSWTPYTPRPRRPTPRSTRARAFPAPAAAAAVEVRGRPPTSERGLPEGCTMPQR